MKKNNVSKRILAVLLSSVCAFSTITVIGTASAVNANAAAASAAVSSDNAVVDLLFENSDKIISFISGGDPVASAIGTGVSVLLKYFYGGEHAQPTTKDITDKLDEMSKKIDTYYNSQMQQFSTIIALEGMGSFDQFMLAVKDANRTGAKHLALFKDHMTEADLENMVAYTVKNADCVSAFNRVSILISEGSGKGAATLPIFRQYIKYAEYSDTNKNDYQRLKNSSESFMNTVMEQYTALYSILMMGRMCEYELQNMYLADGTISKQKYDSNIDHIRTEMGSYTEYAKSVVDARNDAKNAIGKLKKAEVTINGCTKQMYSMADAWAEVTQNGGTIKLLQDWDTASFKDDLIFYKANTAFKGDDSKSLYANGCKVTLDLNGFSIKHSDKRNYDICIENNANVTITDSTNSGKSVIGGIYTENSNLTVNNITITGAAGTGITSVSGRTTLNNCRLSNLTDSAVKDSLSSNISINGCIFENNRNSAVYCNNGDYDINKCIFRNNTSDKGGAINNANGRIKISGCTFDSNSASYGGAIYAKSFVDTYNSVFTNNSCSGCGGAMMFDYHGSDSIFPYTIDGCTFTKNSANNDGGAIYCDSMNNLFIYDTTIQNNTCGNNGDGLYAQKGSYSSCDPVIGGKIIITDNHKTNGTNSNVFLGENTTSKCIFNIDDQRHVTSDSRIGITSPTTDQTLDIVKIFSRDAYNKVANVFFYDTNAYRTNTYTHFYSEFFWVEIVKN